MQSLFAIAEHLGKNNFISVLSIIFLNGRLLNYAATLQCGLKLLLKTVLHYIYFSFWVPVLLHSCKMIDGINIYWNEKNCLVVDLLVETFVYCLHKGCFKRNGARNKK